MSSLPDNAVCYKQTAPFTPENLPEKFRKNHHTKAGVWGEISMQTGRLMLTRYAMDGSDTIVEEIELAEGNKAVFAPQEPHSVEFLDPDGAFIIGFYRVEDATEQQPKADQDDAAKTPYPVTFKAEDDQEH